jgi:hypothetical protein
VFSNVDAQFSSKASVILFLKQNHCKWTPFVQVNMFHKCTMATHPLINGDWDCAAWIRLQQWNYSNPIGNMHTLAEPVYSKAQGCNKPTTMHHHHHHSDQKFILKNHIWLLQSTVSSHHLELPQSWDKYLMWRKAVGIWLITICNCPYYTFISMLQSQCGIYLMSSFVLLMLYLHCQSSNFHFHIFLKH